MIDWFYEHFGTSVTVALHLFIVLVIIVMTKNMIVELKSDDDTYKSRFIFLVLSTYLVCGGAYFIEKQAIRDYAVRTFGDEYVAKSSDSEISDRIDKQMVERGRWNNYTESDRMRDVLDWANSTNLNITTVEDDYHKNGAILEINRDVEFGSRRNGSDNK